MSAARYVSLSEAEDNKLREIEQNGNVREKVRLRAKILRLSHRGMSAGELASYTGRHKASVLRDYDRWERQGLAGLADGSAPGVKSPLGERERLFLHERLAEERSWTAKQLAEAVQERFKIEVNRESMRVCLHELGYSWQRHRYVP
ncbi:MAG: winged helix-turn-helix domain-containing protein, partial [Deinococcota bacterium]